MDADTQITVQAKTRRAILGGVAVGTLLMLVLAFVVLPEVG